MRIVRGEHGDELPELLGLLPPEGGRDAVRRDGLGDREHALRLDGLGSRRQSCTRLIGEARRGADPDQARTSAEYRAAYVSAIEPPIEWADERDAPESERIDEGAQVVARRSIVYGPGVISL